MLYHRAMHKGRLEAFSDGVFAIIITIMVLELHAPEDKPHLADLRPLIPVFLSYLLSFLYVGIYWNNHHHLLQGSDRISGSTLWANLHLLFWLSLVPFVTSWIGSTHFAPMPVAVYGGVLLLSAVAFNVLQRTLIREGGSDSLLAQAIGRDYKGKVSVIAYAIGIVIACLAPRTACLLYAAVGFIWLIPDRRIEKQFRNADAPVGKA